MSIGRTLKSYIWWTHERGSVHYDVMVTLILAFIFITPHFFNYGDRPKPDWPAGVIRASVNPAGGMIYEVPIEMVRAQGGQPTDQDFVQAIAPTSGPIVVDRFAPIREIGGSVVAWRVWGHR
ncbi:MAG: hypothetical protein ACLGXA_00340 [Acidobacteriota bacterium]